MRITEGLGVYWRSLDSAQVGLDERTGVILDGLSRRELTLLAHLTRSLTEVELTDRAKDLGVSKSRALRIVSMLERAGVMEDVESGVPSPDSGPAWRIRHEKLDRRTGAKVFIPHLDQLGAGIAMGLADAGIGTIVTTDFSRVGVADHPALRSEFLGTPRVPALTTSIRRREPRVRILSEREDFASRPERANLVDDVDLAILTGSHLPDPLAGPALAARGVRVLHAWVEEVDLYVGPLTIPHESACAACLFQARLDADPAWDRLAQQALLARPVEPETTSRELAVALAVREIVDVVDGAAPSLSGALWRIPPTPGLPEQLQVEPHERCGCTMDRSAQLTAVN